MTAHIGSPPLAACGDIVRALPTPAALVDDDGRVLVASQSVNAEVGEQLVVMHADNDGGVSDGVGGRTRWRIRRVGDSEPLHLATIERFGTGDHMLRRFFADSDKLYVTCDQAGRIIDWNDAWTDVFGYSDPELIGLDAWTLLPPEDLAMRAVVEDNLRRHGRAEPSWRMRAADDSYRVIEWVLMFDPTSGRCFGIGKSVANTTTPSDELHRRAYTDDLTGLASRSRTIAELASHLRSGSTPALLFCDLDQFKVINDSLGHISGDHLLAGLGHRLSAALNDATTMVGRLGGDEFAVVIDDATLASAKATASKAFEAIRSPFEVAGRSVTVGMSVGICVAEGHETDTAELMFERADLAVYRAKERGRNQAVVFGPQLQEQVDRRFEIETALRSGLANNEFEPWFQPVVNIRSTEIVGVEALLRWRRDSNRVIAPSSFLDIAIETGLITEIGRQMIDRALGGFSSIGNSMGPEVWLTLNVSARELMDTGFTEWFVNRVGAAELRPSQIVLEITESVAIEEQSLSDQLSVLRALGFRIALDDFGTGHSSLAHLRTLPIDMVKIDRTFVANLVDDPTTRALTTSVVDMCGALGLSVVFEGVETKAESIAVVQAGGEFAQGFLHARPMPVSDLQWRTVSAALVRRLGQKNLAQIEAAAAAAASR